jgi:DNA-binding MarR family transcriptional regulator
MTTSPPTVAPGVNTVRGGREADQPRAAELTQAQLTLLILGQLGITIHDALTERVAADMVGNAEVLILTKLDLEGALRPSDVMLLTGMSSGGVTKLLDRLEQGGLVLREFGTVPGDRRGTRIILTAEGQRAAISCATALASRMDVLKEAVEELRAAVGD